MIGAKHNFESWENVFKRVINKNIMGYQNLSYELGTIIFLENWMLEIQKEYKFSNVSAIIIEEILNSAFLEKYRVGQNNVSFTLS